MKKVTVEVGLGLKAQLPVAESVDEFDKLAKRAGACLDGACKNEIYRDGLPQWWDAVAESLKATTKVPYNLIPHPKDATKKVRDPKDTNPKYVARVVALNKATVAEVQAIADAISSGKQPILGDDGKQIVVDGKPAFYSVEFDPSVSVRTSGPAGPGKRALAWVEATRTQCITKAGDKIKGTALFLKGMNVMATKSGQPVVPADATDTKFAEVYKAYNDWVAATASAGMFA